MQNVRKKYTFISYLRVIGMILVAWPHLGYILNPNWKVLKWTNLLLNTPLVIIQNFGALGTGLFFLISGFLSYGNQDSRKKFVGKKIGAIVLPLWFYNILFILFESVWHIVTGRGTYWSQFDINDWIRCITLWGFIEGSGDVVNGVLWYLLPLFMFWILLLAVPQKRFERRRVSLIFPIIVDATVFVLSRAKLTFIPAGIATYSGYVCMPLFGWLIAAMHNDKPRSKRIILLGIFNYVVLVYSFHEKFTGSYYDIEPYLPSFIYAMLIFIICLLINDKLKENKRIEKLAKYSYAFYIQHSLYGGLIITELYVNQGWVFSLAFVCGIIACIFIAVITHHIKCIIFTYVSITFKNIKSWRLKKGSSE